MRAATIFLLATLVTACTPRNPEPAGSPPPEPVEATPVAELVDRDLASLDGEAAQAAEAGLAAALGRPWSRESPGPWQPLRVLMVLDQPVAVLADREAANRLLVAGSGWQRELALTPGCGLAAVKAVRRDGLDVPLLDLHLEGVERGRAERLVLALEPGRVRLVRTLAADGRLRDHRLAEDHPGLRPQGGELASGRAIEQLAALVALAQPAAVAERARPAVRSHLDRLSLSADPWLAAAAAEVAVLPTE